MMNITRGADREAYAANCRAAADEAYADAQLLPIGSEERTMLLVEASDLYDLAAQASV